MIERELGPLIRGLRRAPGAVPERDRFADGEAIDPRWVSFLVSKPPLADASMPAWVRVLQPLLSGVFTVDNLDYVRRDAYLTGVSMGPVDAERLRRYTFVSERGLTLYESGVGALEMFLTARLFMYQHVYLHRTVRAIDLDLARGVRAVDRGGVRRRVAGGAARRRSPTSTSTRCSTRRRAGRAASTSSARARRPGDGTVTPAVPTAGARSCSAARAGAPRPRSGLESTSRRCPAERGRAARRRRARAVVIDLVGVDARPGAGSTGRARDRARATGRPGRRWRRRSAAAGVAPHRQAIPPRRVTASRPARVGSLGGHRRRVVRAPRGPIRRRRRRSRGRPSAGACRGGTAGSERVDPGDLEPRQPHPLRDVGSNAERGGLGRREQAVVEVAAGRVAGGALVAEQLPGVHDAGRRGP